jgi:hypothetical protein
MAVTQSCSVIVWLERKRSDVSHARPDHNNKLREDLLFSPGIDCF